MCFDNEPPQMSIMFVMNIFHKQQRSLEFRDCNHHVWHKTY